MLESILQSNLYKERKVTRQGNRLQVESESGTFTITPHSFTIQKDGELKRRVITTDNILELAGCIRFSFSYKDDFEYQLTDEVRITRQSRRIRVNFDIVEEGQKRTEAFFSIVKYADGENMNLEGEKVQGYFFPLISLRVLYELEKFLKPFDLNILSNNQKITFYKDAFMIDSYKIDYESVDKIAFLSFLAPTSFLDRLKISGLSFQRAGGEIHVFRNNIPIFSGDKLHLAMLTSAFYSKAILT